VAFSRVVLEAGARATVSLPFDLADLAVRHEGGWLQETGRYVLEVGTDAERISAATDVFVTNAG